MASFNEISKKLREFGIVGCHVRTRNIIAFSAQKWDEDDTMVPRRTMLFFFYPDEEKAEQWAASEWDLMTGIHGCACFAPNERASEPLAFRSENFGKLFQNAADNFTQDN